MVGYFLNLVPVVLLLSLLSVLGMAVVVLRWRGAANDDHSGSRAAGRTRRWKGPLVWTAVIAFFFTAMCGYVPYVTPFIGNAICLIMNRGYIIPGHSSMFTFEVTEMNDGSGEWWMTGEDGNYFYYQAMEYTEKYLAFKKSDVAKCPGFDPRDNTTWCGEHVIKGT